MNNMKISFYLVLFIFNEMYWYSKNLKNILSAVIVLVSVAAVTRDHKFSGLKQYVWSHISRGQKPKISLIRGA